MVWRLVARDKVRLVELDSLSIDEAEAAGAMLDTWDAAGIRADKKRERRR